MLTRLKPLLLPPQGLEETGALLKSVVRLNEDVVANEKVFEPGCHGKSSVRH
jgi:hypothetical protein